MAMVTTKESKMLPGCNSAFRLMLATSWLAPEPWREYQCRAIRSALHLALDWDEYLTLVERHGTPALSWEVLKRVPDANLPATVRQALQRRHAACRMQATRLTSLLVQVLKDFNQTGIPLIPLKGPLLSLELYGDLGIRHSQDIDIMVALGDLPAAQARIEKMGWRVHLQPTFSPRHSEVSLKIYHHIVYWHPLHRYFLELHWRTRWETPDRTAGQWMRSTELVWNGLRYRALSRTDLTLHLCEHGSGHAWFRSKWLSDLARIYAMDYVDWNAAFWTARSVGIENSLLQCLRLLNELYGLPVPETLHKSAGRLPAVLLDRVAMCMRAPVCMLAPPKVHRIPFFSRLRLAMGQLRYERLLRPRRSWRQAFMEAAYSSADFELLHLPDRLFWLYLPLRPFLLAWRWLRHPEPKPPEEVAELKW
ncbi:MAG: nucleotidyltransferase family protein [Terracidiphilus sp.]